VAAARVRILSWNEHGSYTDETTSDINGRFHCDVHPGTIRVIAAETDELTSDWVHAIDPEVPLAPRQIAAFAIKMIRKSKLRGTVRTAEGPVVGATVYLRYTGSDYHISQRCAATNEHGEYQLDGLPPGSAFMYAACTGLYLQLWPSAPTVSNAGPPEALKVLVVPGVEVTRDFDMRVGADVHGRVEGPGGPLSGVRVKASSSPVASTLTRDDGTFALKGVVPGPRVSFELSLDRYVASPLNGSVDVAPDRATTGVVLHMDQLKYLATSVESDDGMALIGAVLHVDRTDGRPAEANVEGTSYGADVGPVDADGIRRVPIAIEAGGSATVTASATDYQDSTSATVRTIDGQNSYRVRIVMDAGHDLHGRIVDVQGTPVEGAGVSLKKLRADGSGRVSSARGSASIWAVSDSSGEFKAQHLSRGSYEVIVDAAGFLRSTSLVDLPNADGVRIALNREYAITGSVRDGDGSIVDGASVRAVRSTAGSGVDAVSQSSGTTVTGPDGSFILGKLAIGNYCLIVSPDVGGILNIEETAVEGVQAGTTDVTVVVSQGKIISGRVVDSTRRAVRAVSVAADLTVQFPYECKVADQMRISTTDAGGRFELRGLRAVNYRLRFTPDNSVSAGSVLPLVYEAVPAGSEGLDVVLEDGLMIDGVVVDPDGHGVSGLAMAFAGIAVGSEASPTTTVTDSLGGFHVGGLTPGEYTIALDSGKVGPSYVMQSIETVPAGSRGIRLAVVAASAITGAVFDETGVAIRNASVVAVAQENHGAQRGALTDSNGAFSIGGLLPGTGYTILVYSIGNVVSRVRNTTGGGQPLHIVCVRGGACTGRVIDGSGSPVKQAILTVWLTGDPDQTQGTTTGDDGSFKLEGLVDGPYDAKVYVDRAYRSCGTIRQGQYGLELRIPSK
jgi:hypothetical protein